MRTLRIVVVDANDLAQRMLKRLLTHTGGVEIVGACLTIEDALPILEAGGVDLIIAEYWFPRTGEGPQPTVLDLLQRLPADGPALVVHAGMPEPIPAHLPQPLEVLHKPVHPDELRAFVDRVRLRLHGPAA